ncbi:MAG: hypothetical protein ACLGI8_15045 [Acidimicrobiia bacterium]
MTSDHPFSVEAARAAADNDLLGPWVAAFLASPGSDNAPLADKLADRFRFWTGPLRLPIAQLHRLAGPPGEPVLCTVDDDYWRDDVDEMAEQIDDEDWTPPPVVVTLQGDQLVLEDGNHRVEGLRRAGEEGAWAVVGFDTADERDRFEPPTAPSGPWRDGAPAQS